jgi:elongation factor Ts
VASKRADKEANEGIVLAKTNTEKNFAVNIMVNCETDFVAKNDEFKEYVNKLVELALENKPGNMDDFLKMKMNAGTVEEILTDMIGKIGERLSISRYEFIDAPSVFSYNHHGNRLATIVGFNKADGDNLQDIGHEIAMQIAAMNPIAIDRDDVDPEIIKQEIEIGKEQARNEGKPEQILEKIAMGKLNKFYKENTLVNQDFVRDTKKTVGQYLKENDNDLKIVKFTRLMLGE